MTEDHADGPDPEGQVAGLKVVPLEHPIESALVRFRARRDGAVVGAGFLVTGTELVTCAHVVAEAAGTNPDAADPPEGTITVELPFLGSGQLEARVVKWRPIGADRPEDIAVLSLPERAPGSAARPLPLLAPAQLAGRSFEVCGFPQGNDEGAWAEGRMGHRRADGTVQVGDPNQTGYAIEPGFSGAPIWDVLARGVIGMVVARERRGETKVAFVLPVDLLTRVWPLQITEAHDPFAHLTAGVHESLGGLRQLLAEYVGWPGAARPFGGRGRSFDALDRWLEQPVPYALLVAEAGRGKTALLARWASAIAALGKADVVFVPISIRFGTASHTSAMRLLLERLRHVLGVPGDFVADPTTWPSEVQRLFQETQPDAAQRLLLILDGVDEATGWTFDRDLRFPVPSPDWLKVIVSARRTVDRDADEWVDRLYWRGQAECFDLDPLDRRGVEEVLTSLGHDRLDLRPLTDALYRLTGGDPLELQLYARQLQVRGDTAAVGAAELSERAPGLDGFFELWWEDQLRMWSEQGRDDLAESEDIYRLLHFAAIAEGPLDYEDFAALCGGRLKQGPYLQRKLSELGRFLIPASHEHEKGLVLAHPRLNLFFASPPRMLEDERENLERQLFEYCRAALVRVKEGGGPKRVSAYAVRHLGMHADSQYGDGKTLYELVDPAWYRAWQAFEDAAEGFLGDVDRARRRAEADCGAAASAEGSRPPVRMQIRCALVVSSLTTQAENLRPGLIAALLQAQLWTPQIAMEYALRPGSDDGRTACLTALFGLLPPPERAEALATITQMQWPTARWGLTDLSESLNDQELRGLLDVGADHHDAGFEVALLTEQARRSAGAEQDDLIGAALDRTINSGGEVSGRSLASLVGLLSPQRQSELASGHPDLYVKALEVADDPAGLIANIPQEMVSAVIEIAARASSKVYLGRLLARLPASERQPLVTSIAGRWWSGPKSEMLSGLAAAVAPEEFEDTAAQALNEALAADDNQSSTWLGTFLEAIGSRLPPRLADRAFDAVERGGYISAEMWIPLAKATPARVTPAYRLSALKAGISYRRDLAVPLITQLLELTPEANRVPMLEAALGELEATPLQGYNLGQLAEFLPPEPRARAREAARNGEPAQERASALLGLARYAEGEERRQLLREALAAVNTVDDAQDIVQALAGLPGELGQEPRERVLQYAFRPVNRRWALATPALARQLPPGQAHQLLHSIMQDDDRASDASVPEEEIEALAGRVSADVLRDLLGETDKRAHPGMALKLLAALARTGDPTVAGQAKALLSDLWHQSSESVPFWDFYRQLPPAQQAGLLDEALSFVHGLAENLPDEVTTGDVGSSEGPDIDEQLGYMLQSLPQDVPTPVQLAVVAATETLTDSRHRADALTGMSDSLTEEAIPAALDRALALPEEALQAQVISGLAPHLRDPALARADQAVRSFSDPLARLMGTVALIEQTSPELRVKIARDAVEEAAKFAPVIKGSYQVQEMGRPRALALDDALIHRILTVVLPSLPPDERPRALAVSERWLAALPEIWRGPLLNETVDHLCDRGLHEDALWVARRIPDPTDEQSSPFSGPGIPGRPEALAAVARFAGRPDLTTEALEAFLAIPSDRPPDFDHRDRLVTGLRQLAANLVQFPPALLCPLVQRILRHVTQAGRPRLVEVLAALAPALTRLAGTQDADDLANEILDVAEWLP